MIPPLSDGDRLTRDEFLRRWETMPDVKWADLIDGVVYLPSLISEIHSDFHGRLSSWMSYYVATTPGSVPRPAPTTLMSENSTPARPGTQDPARIWRPVED